MAKIERVIKGQAPSLMESTKANQLIDAINGILASRAQDPIKLVVNGDNSFNLNFNLSPMDVTICVDGEPVKKVIYVQSVESDE